MIKLLNCVKYDFKEGIIKNWYLYLIEIFLVAIFSVNAILYMDNSPGIFEVSLKVFEGMEEYDPELGTSFKIPMEYLSFTLLAGIFVCNYPKREWKLRGSQVICRYENTDTWWYSKVIWNIIQSIFIYLAAFLVIYISSVIAGNAGFAVRYEMPYSGMLLNNDSLTVFLYCYILGAVTMIAINQIIVTLQMIISPVTGYISALIILIISAYYFKAYLPGNNFMLLRTVLFREDGIVLHKGMLLAFIIWAVCVVAGRLVLKRKDIL